ncbi:DNA methylase family protein [Synechococcus sp. A18-40]|nr:DNA methylase family protein [Synechococcus sp. A18-40]
MSQFATPSVVSYLECKCNYIMTMSAEVISLHDDLTVTEVAVNKIRTRFRLRTPQDDKIEELAHSIKLCGLINPVTIDQDYYLLAGWHRWQSYIHLGYKTIPCIIKDTTQLRGELIEVEENLSRVELDAIEVAEHIDRREQILQEMGLRMNNGGNQYSEGMTTTPELAKQLGMSKATYLRKKSVINISEEVRDLLKGTEWAKNTGDMLKLSQQAPELQLRIANYLITGEYRTFKRALTIASLLEWDLDRGDRGVDFNVKDRWGIPQSIMSFKKADVHLQELVDLVNKSDGVQIQKRTVHFGSSEVPNYMMMADHSEFLVDYYTDEGDYILENMMGRGSNVLACLYHKRRVVGIDCNVQNVDKVREVCTKYFSGQVNDFELYHDDGVELKKWEDQSDVFDAVITDPPYVCKAEQYGVSDWDVGQLDHQEYLRRIERMMGNLARLIKTSDYDQKIFKPIIIKVGSGRRSDRGIIDMDFEYQRIARDNGLVLWDKVFNKLENVWGNLCAVRNYQHRYVQKNFETNLCWVKFKGG